MEEEVNGRQRQLEREIACLKDTIWRLTSRVCVVESFLKNKYGNISAVPTVSSSSPPPVKVIPIVIPQPDAGVEPISETHVIVKDIDPLAIDEDVANEEVVTESEPLPAAVTDTDGPNYIETFGVDGQLQDESSANGDSAMQEESSVSIAAVTPCAEEIRIYKPELKTFVTVKLEAAAACEGSNQVTVVGDLECHICHKNFSLQENFQRHLLQHRASQFKCDECGRVFHHQGNLNTHKLRHERMNRRKQEMEDRMKSAQQKPQADVENRKFPCSYCDKRFYTSQQRNIHTRIHTGEKPFECSVCGMRFNQKASLQDHSLGHVGDKTNCCHLCPASFVRSRNLLKHIRQVHKMVQIKTVLDGERVVEFVPQTEAAAIIESRKNNIEFKKPQKNPRVRRPKQQTNNNSRTVAERKRKAEYSEPTKADVKHLRIEQSSYIISGEDNENTAAEITT